MRLPVPVLDRPVRLLVADLDGCVSGGPGWHFDTQLFGMLQEYARRAETDPAVPHMTFNTGRPQPYAECMARFAGVRHSVLCEFGLVLWELPGRAVRLHPQFGDSHREAHRRLLAEAERRAGPRFSIEAGKTAQATLIPRKPLATHDILAECGEIIAAAGGGWRIDCTHAVVSFLPEHLGKGAGLRWLAEELAIDPSEMAGVGDSGSDWEFLEPLAVSYAPANAVPELKARVTHVSAREAGAVMHDIFEALIAGNRRLGVG
jgi:hypothetical protein